MLIALYRRCHPISADTVSVSTRAQVSNQVLHRAKPIRAGSVPIFLVSSATFAAAALALLHV